MLPPGVVNVKSGSRKRVRKQAAPRQLLSADDRKRKAGVTFSFENVSRKNWEKAFGPFDPNKFRKAKAAQDAAKKQDFSAPLPAAVHGDNKRAGRRLYNGFDWGLGATVQGRSHHKRLMAERNLREAH